MNNDLVNVFCQLVRIDSPTGEEEKLANFLVGYLRNEKLVDKIQKDQFGNVHGHLDGEGEPFFFAAHLDTVEPGRGINPQVSKGYIQSDGTTILGADNKVAIACIIEALKQLRSLHHLPIELVFTRSEESGNYGAINFDYALLKSKKGYCMDYASSVGTLIQASPFYERFNLDLIGQESHASLPEEAINALSLLSELLKRLHLGRLDEDSLLNIGVVNGGMVRNTIPGKISLQGELRSFNEDSLLKHKEDFIKAVKAVVSESKADFEIEFVRENPGYQFRTDDPFIEWTKGKMEQVGINSKLIKAWGVSDANIFHEHGLSCVNLGNGEEFAHSVRERIKISQMEELVKVILTLTSV